MDTEKKIEHIICVDVGVQIMCSKKDSPLIWKFGKANESKEQNASNIENQMRQSFLCSTQL